MEGDFSLWWGTLYYGGVLFIMVGYSLLWWVPLIRVGWESGRGGARFIIVGHFSLWWGTFH